MTEPTTYHGTDAIEKFFDQHAHPIPDQEEYNQYHGVLIGLQEEISRKGGELIATVHFRDTYAGGNIVEGFYASVLESINVAILPPAESLLSYQSSPDNLIEKLFNRDAVFTIPTGGYAKVHVFPRTTNQFIEWRNEEFPLVDGYCFEWLLFPEACSGNNTMTRLAIGNQKVANIWKGINTDLFELFWCIKQAADLVSTTLDRPLNWDTDLKEIAKLANIRASHTSSLPVKTAKAM